MNVIFGIVKETYAQCNSMRVSYGIAVYADPAEGGIATVIASVRDITADEAALRELVQVCNRQQLSPDQLYEVVEDFLGNCT